MGKYADNENVLTRYFDAHANVVAEFLKTQFIIKVAKISVANNLRGPISFTIYMAVKFSNMSRLV